MRSMLARGRHSPLLKSQNSRSRQRWVKATYRAAIVRAHPDKGGSNEHAAIINAACAFLKPFSK